MNVIVEKREVVGTLKTLLGTFPLLSLRLTYHTNDMFAETLDDEGFSNVVRVHGDFVVIPVTFARIVYVKRVAAKEEEQEVEILTAATID